MFTFWLPSRRAGSALASEALQHWERNELGNHDSLYWTSTVFHLWLYLFIILIQSKCQVKVYTIREKSHVSSAEVYYGVVSGHMGHNGYTRDTKINWSSQYIIMYCVTHAYSSLILNGSQWGEMFSNLEEIIPHGEPYTLN